ncbi:porin [Chitinibacter sp. S2-10]|uniref:porin n=1 Tax=Chitinibacter sp. S2-10 TaxID=3373597 RepID=UPI00397782C8
MPVGVSPRERIAADNVKQALRWQFLRLSRDIIMQIKFLASAVAAALLSVAAQAEVTIGGFIQAEVSYNDNQTDADGKQDFYQNLYDVGSDIRVQGSHDVTATGKFQWEISTYLDKDMAPASLAFLGDRKLYVRYADSELGSLTVGRDDSPMRMAFNRYDIFNGYASLGTVFNRNSTSRPSNQVKYVSPKMNGLTVRVAGLFGTTDGTSEPERGYHGTVSYDVNPMFNFDLGMSVENDRGEINGKDRDAWLAGVRGELMPNLTYGIAYVNASNWAAAGASESKNWMVAETLQYVMGDHTFRMGHSHEDASAANLYLLGYEYALPEVAMGATKISSALYLELSHIDNKAGGDRVTGNDTDGVMLTTAGTDPTTLAAGFYISF